jgi:hypothetical protein
VMTKRSILLAEVSRKELKGELFEGDMDFLWREFTFVLFHPLSHR